MKIYQNIDIEIIKYHIIDFILKIANKKKRISDI